MDEDLKEVILGILVTGFLIAVFVLSIAIPIVIVENKKIDAELKMKELEKYGEYVNEVNE